MLNRPFLCALVSTTATLGIGAALIQRAHFGVPPAMALVALAFLFTIGLPAVLGVAGVATVWGSVPGLVGFNLFVLCASAVALGFQYGTYQLLRRALRPRLVSRRKK